MPHLPASISEGSQGSGHGGHGGNGGHGGRPPLLPGRSGSRQEGWVVPPAVRAKDWKRGDEVIEGMSMGELPAVSRFWGWDGSTIFDSIMPHQFIWVHTTIHCHSDYSASLLKQKFHASQCVRPAILCNTILCNTHQRLQIHVWS